MTIPADYQAALDYIFNYVDYERRRSVPYDEIAWDLDRARRVLAALGDPHQRLRFVHVAGSKGKGSTAAMIEAVLRASGGQRRPTPALASERSAGASVGFYTSPHLHTFRERIRIDGRLLDREDLIRLLAQSRPAIEAVPGITSFEIITVLALLHFAQQQVDWVVLEVGLGGRLDATNVVAPAVSVITPISYEHAALLGNTLAEIAAEKAGIVKPGVPVVSAPQAAEALAVIRETCRERAAPLVEVGRDWTWQPEAEGLDGQVFSVSCRLARQSDRAEAGLPETLRRLQIPLLGSYQLANATTAVAVCRELAGAGLAVDEDGLRRGLAGVYWPGRLEVLQRPEPGRPAVVVDSAHTGHSARLLRAALAGYFPGLKPVWVFGASNDKDIDAILAELAPAADQVFTVRSRHPRAADDGELAALAMQHAAPERVHAAGRVADGLAQALERADDRSLVCITGSLFVVAEAREAWLAGNPLALSPADWARQAEPPEPTWQVSQK